MKYREKDMTNWFKPNVKPVRAGVYNGSYYKRKCAYRLWTGTLWMTNRESVEDAAKVTRPADRQDAVFWRGLNKEPK